MILAPINSDLLSFLPFLASAANDGADFAFCDKLAELTGASSANDLYSDVLLLYARDRIIFPDQVDDGVSTEIIRPQARLFDAPFTELLLAAWLKTLGDKRAEGLKGAGVFVTGGNLGSRRWRSLCFGDDRPLLPSAGKPLLTKAGACCDLKRRVLSMFPEVLRTITAECPLPERRASGYLLGWNPGWDLASWLHELGFDVTRSVEMIDNPNGRDVRLHRQTFQPVDFLPLEKSEDGRLRVWQVGVVEQMGNDPLFYGQKEDDVIVYGDQSAPRPQGVIQAPRSR